MPKHPPAGRQARLPALIRQALLALIWAGALAVLGSPALAIPLGHPAPYNFYPRTFASGQTIIVLAQKNFDPAALPTVKFGTTASNSVRLTPDGKELHIRVPALTGSGNLSLEFRDLRIVVLGPFVLIAGKIWIPCSGSPPTYAAFWTQPQSPTELALGTSVTGKVTFKDGSYTPGHWLGETAGVAPWPWKTKSFFSESTNIGRDGTKLFLRVRGSYAIDMCDAALGDQQTATTLTGIFDVKGINGGQDPAPGGPLPDSAYPYPPGDSRLPDLTPVFPPRYPCPPVVKFPLDASAISELHGEVNLDAPPEQYQLLNYTQHRDRGSIPTLCKAPLIVHTPPADGSPAPEQELKLGLTLIAVKCSQPTVAAFLQLQPFDPAVAGEDYEFYAWRDGVRQRISQWPYQSMDDLWQNSSKGAGVYRCTPSRSFKITFRAKSQPNRRAPRPLSLACRYHPRQTDDPNTTSRAFRQTCVELNPLQIIAHKRGTMNAPGEAVPAGTGEFGYETVMMENADSESADKSTSRDCTVSGTTANLNSYRKSGDDDLVKIILKFPAGFKNKNASLKVIAQGMEVNATQKTAATAVRTAGASRLNFFKADGSRITNPITDLQIADLANPPENAYLSKILDDGQITLFIEGADSFGNLPASRMDRLGGAHISWEFRQGTTIITEKLLVYRGGFLRFLQPVDAPGTAGTFEFRDGKGRIRNRNDGYRREFGLDDTDLGKVLNTGSAKSGKTVESGASTDYRLKNKRSNIPPGWWSSVENNLALSETQMDGTKSPGIGYIQAFGDAGEFWNQAAFCRWKQDDLPLPEQRYSENWEFNSNIEHDKLIGRPTFIEYKFRLSTIFPTNTYDRSGLLIHPDGERNGTLGCIGIQTYEQCTYFRRTLQNYHGLKIKVQLLTNNEN